MSDFLSGMGSLSHVSQDSLTKNLGYDEMKNIVMKDCDHNKSPGLDGKLKSWPQDFVRVGNER